MRLPSPRPGSPSTLVAAPPSWPPLLATRGPGGESAGHAHHAMHLVLAIDGELTCTALGERVAAAGILTAPDVPHALDARGREVFLVFLDPESQAGAALLATLALDADGDAGKGKRTHRPLRAITARERDALLVDADPVRCMAGEGVAWSARAVELLAKGTECVRPPPIHPRVRRVLRHLAELEARGEASDADTSLASLAAVAELSESRFLHAFTDSIGIPLRPYLAWRRLQRAAAAITTGATFVEAAHFAGYTDAAHLTRSFVRMLGMRPKELRSLALAAGRPRP